MRKLLLILLFLCPLAHATTYYVNSGGGTRYSVNATSGLCDGTSSAAPVGTTPNQHCAFNDVRYLWTDGSYTVSPTAGKPAWGWLGVAGDTYLIDCTSLNCRIGQSGPNSGDGFGLAGDPFEAGAPPPPDNSTIEGINYANCSSDAAKTKVFGGYADGFVFNLKGTTGVTIRCLDITDHGDCVKSGTLNRCATNYPLSDFADSGFISNRNTTGLTVQDVNLHGFTNAAWLGPVGGTDTVNRVKMIANGNAGWNADLGDGTTGYGDLLVEYFTIGWNGCSEEYPIVDALPYIDCTDDITAGGAGYGDGFGTATVTSSPAWHVTFSYGTVNNNTQDGLDSLHIQGGGSSLSVDHVLAYGNMGNQVKEGVAGSITNSLITGDCAAMKEAIPGTPSGFNSQLGDFCRAGNEPVIIGIGDGATSTFAFNTVYGSGWTGGGDLGGIVCGTTCTAGTAALIYENNITVGFAPDGVTPARYTNGTSINPFTQTGSKYDHNVSYGTSTACPDTGETFALCALPQLVNTSWLLYGYGSMAPTSGTSNVVGAGIAITGITTDYNGTIRPNPPSIGAWEFATNPSTGAYFGGSVVIGGSVTF